MYRKILNFLMPYKNPLQDKQVLFELLRSLYLMASVVEAKDPCTGGHLWRVSQYSKLLAKALNLSDFEVAKISFGGFLHDLGKVSVPEQILNKPGKLTDDEYAVIKTHPAIGVSMLEEHPLLSLVKDAILLHHEMVNGRGYPNNLKQDEIPLVAKIVAVSDSFDAMTSNRPYRKGMPVEQALNIIKDNLGGQFDHEIGSIFLGLSQNFDLLAHVVNHSEPNMPLQACPACGPIIVITRQHKTGDLLYCRHCGGEAQIANRDGDKVELKPTGAKGAPHRLMPTLDHQFIEELALEQANYLHQ